MTQRADGDAQAELDDLRRRLGALEAKHLHLLRDARRSGRAGFGRKAFLGILSLAGLLAAGGLLYGQGAGDALFIDPRGWIGIGTNKPNATLDVAGNLNVSDSATVSNTTKTGSLETGTLKATKDANLANTAIKGTLTTEGNVGIGAASSAAGLDVSGKANTDKQISLQLRSGNNATSFESNQITFGWSNSETYRHAIKSRHDSSQQKNNALDFYLWQFDKAKPDPAAIGGLLTMTLDGGNVGIGTADPTAKLDVVGAIKATSINGEKPPLIFEVGQKGDTKKWYAVNQDIGPLCGDADGCTIKFFLRENSTDKVRTILEQIYIEQPGKSSNKSPGLHGFTHQLGGGDREFVLQTATKNEIVPYPWNWIYVRNYQSPDVGKESNAFGGYQVQFMTRANISATVIIYDR